MARVTFTVPPELKARLQERRDVNWSAWVARVLERRLDDLERWEAEEAEGADDIEELSAIIKKAAGARWRREVQALEERRRSSSTRTDSSAL